jgi:hypothetical protein
MRFVVISKISQPPVSPGIVNAPRLAAPFLKLRGDKSSSIVGLLYIVVIQEPGAPERRAMTMSSRTMINFSGKQWS